jgi:membrane-associated phospholipid phosphatase
LVGTAVEARRGHPDWERRIYRSINDAPDELAPVAWLPMQAGSLSAPFVLAGWSYWRTRDLDPAVAYAASGFATWLAAKGVKMVIGRGRPHDHDPTTNLRLATRTDGSLGYVSGHAAVASTIATVMGSGRPTSIAAVLQASALFVGITRIYAGAHLPLDVVGGAALGILVGEATNSIRSRTTG